MTHRSVARSSDRRSTQGRKAAAAVRLRWLGATVLVALALGGAFVGQASHGRARRLGARRRRGHARHGVAQRQRQRDQRRRARACCSSAASSPTPAATPRADKHRELERQRVEPGRLGERARSTAASSRSPTPTARSTPAAAFTNAGGDAERRQPRRLGRPDLGAVLQPAAAAPAVRRQRQGAADHRIDALRRRRVPERRRASAIADYLVACDLSTGAASSTLPIRGQFFSGPCTR